MPKKSALDKYETHMLIVLLCKLRDACDQADKEQMYYLAWAVETAFAEHFENGDMLLYEDIRQLMAIDWSNR